MRQRLVMCSAIIYGLTYSLVLEVRVHCIRSAPVTFAESQVRTTVCCLGWCCSAAAQSPCHPTRQPTPILRPSHRIKRLQAAGVAADGVQRAGTDSGAADPQIQSTLQGSTRHFGSAQQPGYHCSESDTPMYASGMGCCSCCKSATYSCKHHHGNFLGTGVSQVRLGVLAGRC